MRAIGGIRYSSVLPTGQPLKTRHAVGDVVVGLFIHGVDRHLRAAEQAGIVERADLDHDGWQSRGAA